MAAVVATPRTLMVPSGARSTAWGVRWRWCSPRARAASSAVAVSPAMRRTSSAGSPPCSSTWARVWASWVALLDEERDALGPTDVEDAHQPVVVEPGRATGGVEGGERVRLLLAEADDDDVALERRVVGRPALGLGQLLEPPLHDVATAEHRGRADPVHVPSSSPQVMVLPTRPGTASS